MENSNSSHIHYRSIWTLCKACREVTFSPEVWTQAWCSRGTLSDRACSVRTLKELQEGLKASCWFCQQVVNKCVEELESTVEEWFNRHAQPNFEIAISIFTVGKADHLRFSVTNYTFFNPQDHFLPSFADGAVDITFELPLFADLGSEVSHYINAPCRKSQYASFDVDTVRSWISSCQTSHQNCQTNSDVVLPSRLIDVSITNGYDSVSLHITSEGERGSYAALSYCWGEGDRPTLKVGTLNAFLLGLWMPDLPKTYTDAIEVTRALGLKYLWIDALCIIQDDSADKLVELPRMHQYYRNALFAISATNAEHVREGFLTRSADIPKTYRLPHLGVIQSRIQEIPVTSRSGKNARAYLTAENSVYAAGTGPIASRAWTLQEHALPDILLEFFSPEGFVFSCATEEKHNEGFRYSRASYISGIRQMLLEKRRLQAQGTSPAMSDQDYGSWGAYLNTSEKRGHTPAETFAAILTLAQMNMPESQRWISTPADRIYDSWNSMVTDYGRRDLKEHGDRLIAISALADEFNRLYAEVVGEYRAGLWEKFLPHSLTWVVHETSIRPAPNSHIDPSWSWAAVFGASYPLHFSQRLSAISLISILKCETNLLEATLPFGSVQRGTLTVKGRAKLTDTWKTELDGKTYLYGETDSEGNNRCVINLDSIDNKIYVGGPVFILPVFLLPVRFQHEASKPPKYICLLLKPGEGNTCCRIGIATSFYIHKASYEAWNERVFEII